MAEEGPLNYMDIHDEDGWGYYVMVEDGEAQYRKIQARIDAGETFREVEVDVVGRGAATLTFDKPVAMCRLRPLEPVSFTGTVQQGEGGKLVMDI